VLRLGTLGARLRAHLREKVMVLLGLSVGICVPYFLLQQLAWRAPRAAWVTPLDLEIAFDPRWIRAYASLALLVPLAPLLTSTREDLARYARGLACLCLPAFLAFLLFPVAGPRPPELPANGLYAWIAAVDRPLNSLPSLHAGLTVYSLLHLWRALADAVPRSTWLVLVGLGVVWGAAIVFSTLATKQHWVADLPGGIALAWAAHAWAWRSSSQCVALATD
jgi:hypothetical protein